MAPLSIVQNLVGKVFVFIQITVAGRAGKKKSLLSKTSPELGAARRPITRYHHCLCSLSFLSSQTGDGGVRSGAERSRAEQPRTAAAAAATSTIRREAGATRRGAERTPATTVPFHPPPFTRHLPPVAVNAPEKVSLEGGAAWHGVSGGCSLKPLPINSLAKLIPRNLRSRLI